MSQSDQIAAATQLSIDQDVAPIRELPPLEIGGVVAREGFSFQDHVAVGFCLDMLKDPTLVEVWCESQDDITLIWLFDDHEEVEFVQVKNEQPDQLWSAALVCKRETSAKDKGLGTSIAERSLAHDRCDEPCRFSLITSREVNRELKPLTYALTAPGRVPVKALTATFQKAVGDFVSLKGNGIEFWLENLIWKVKHSETAVKKENLLKLVEFLDEHGLRVQWDQLEEAIYNKLLKKVQDMALADPKGDPVAKRMTREQIAALVRNLALATRERSGAGGASLEKKMQAANLEADMIESALEQRRAYRRETLTPGYLAVRDLHWAEQEIGARLHMLRSQLDAGLLPDVGPQFHAKCVDELEKLRQDLNATPPGIHQFFVLGCMYDITDRCLHRFRRIEA
jgi:hypothetical protein